MKDILNKRKEKSSRDFPGGPVAKNPPWHAGDLGSIPGWEIKTPHAAKQLSLRATNTEPSCYNGCKETATIPHAPTVIRCSQINTFLKSSNAGEEKSNSSLHTPAPETPVLVAQCPTLCNLMDCSLPDSSVPGILQDKNTGMGCHVKALSYTGNRRLGISDYCYLYTVFSLWQSKQTLNVEFFKKIILGCSGSSLLHKLSLVYWGGFSCYRGQTLGCAGLRSCGV